MNPRPVSLPPFRRPLLPLLLAGFVLLLPIPSEAGAQERQPWRLGSAISTPDWLQLGVIAWVRAEGLDGQFRVGGSGGDQILSLHTSLRADASLGAFRLTIEGLDVRQSLADDGTPLDTGLVNAVDLLQAHVSWLSNDFLVDGSRSRLSVGRFTLDLGSRRLVARHRFRNAINAFTGVDWEWSVEDRQSLRAFYSTPVVRRPSDRESLLDNEIQLDTQDFDDVFWGLYYSRTGLIAGTTLDLFVFGLDEDDSGTGRSRDLLTPGARFYRAPVTGQLDFELEAVAQLGDLRQGGGDAAERLDVSASFFHAEVGYSFAAPWSPRLVVQYDRASGDARADDDTWGRFDPLFSARRFDFGPTGIYGSFSRANISSPGLRLYARPGPAVDLMIAHRGYWLAEAADAWTAAAIRDATGASGSYLGQQIELRARWTLVPGNLGLEIGGAHLFAGSYQETAPGALEAGSSHGYAQTTVTF